MRNVINMRFNPKYLDYVKAQIGRLLLCKMDNIVKVIRDTKEQYEEEPLFSEATTTFMEAHQLKEIREKLGIKG